MQQDKVILTNEVARKMPKYNNDKKHKSIQIQSQMPASTDGICFDDVPKQLMEVGFYYLIQTINIELYAMIQTTNWSAYQKLKYCTLMGLSIIPRNIIINFTLYLHGIIMICTLVFFLNLKNKSESCYTKALINLISNCKYELKPEIVKKRFDDFEKAAQNAFKINFNCKIKIFFNNFSQTLFRQIKEKGLLSLYKSDEYINKWLQLFESLAFHPLYW